MLTQHDTCGVAGEETSRFSPQGANRPLVVLSRGCATPGASQTSSTSASWGELACSCGAGWRGLPDNHQQIQGPLAAVPPQSGCAGQLPRQRESTFEGESFVPESVALLRSGSPLRGVSTSRFCPQGAERALGGSLNLMFLPPGSGATVGGRVRRTRRVRIEGGGELRTANRVPLLHDPPASSQQPLQHFFVFLV